MHHATPSVVSAIALGFIVPAVLGGQDCPPFTLSNPDPVPHTSFGWAVAMSGDRAIVSAQNAGLAYMLRREDDGWVHEDTLPASDSGWWEDYPFAVALDGDVALATSIQHVHVRGLGNGSVYVFRNRGDRWVEEQEIYAADGQVGDGFGRSLAICGEVAIIGASGDDNLAPSSGAAYIYRYDSRLGLWQEEQKLHAADSDSSDGFGFSVDIRGDVAVIGMPGDDLDITQGSGSAYIFRRDQRSGRWAQEQKLTAKGKTGALDDFGWSVAISDASEAGPVVLIGAKFDAEPTSFSGSAYFFRYDGSRWVQEQELTCPSPTTVAQFGQSVDVDGDFAVIGAWKSYAAAPQQGAAYGYKYNSETKQWELVQTMLPTVVPGWLALFGFSVGISGQTAIIGAYGADSGAGAAYVYRFDPIGADLNCDQIINGFDLALLLSNWGPVREAKARKGPALDADLDDDGVVGGLDVALLLAEWG